MAVWSHAAHSLRIGQPIVISYPKLWRGMNLQGGKSCASGQDNLYFCQLISNFSQLPLGWFFREVARIVLSLLLLFYFWPFLKLTAAELASCWCWTFQKKKKHKSSYIWTCFCLGLLKEVSHTIHSAQSEESEIASKRQSFECNLEYHAFDLQTLILWDTKITFSRNRGIVVCRARFCVESGKERGIKALYKKG